MVLHAFGLFIDDYHTAKAAALGQILDHADETFKVVPPELYASAVYVSSPSSILSIALLQREAPRPSQSACCCASTTTMSSQTLMHELQAREPPMHLC